MNTVVRTPQRVQHQLRLRLVQVARVRELSPRMRRVTLSGEELDGFVTLGPDDHVKLFFPAPGQHRPTLPQLGPTGMAFADDAVRPIVRDYTPRCFDPVLGELDIDFVLHGDGPASNWAAQAQPGHWIGVGGPRGSFLLPANFDIYLLVGDETALPAIARHLEELRPGVRARAIVELANRQEEVPLPTDADVKVTWLHRDGLPSGTPALLSEALGTLPLSRSANAYAWLAGEIDTVRLLRRHLIDGIGMPRSHVRAAGYWRAGEAGVHARLDD